MKKNTFLSKTVSAAIAGILGLSLCMSGCSTGTESEVATASPEPTAVSYEDITDTIRVMSQNLDANGATTPTRAPGMIQRILENEPDSIGVQECRGEWNTLLNDGLSEKYARVGVGADGIEGSTAQFGTYIYYLKDKYNVIDTGTFWLSKTPDVPSKYGSTVDCNRTCTWVILENKTTGFRYVHMNCHLDWMDVKATNYQIAMIREQMKRFLAVGLPVLATGDYNSDEGSETYYIMVNDDAIADSKYIATTTMSLGTYPEYGNYDVTETMPIDYCFVTKANVTCSEYKVLTDAPNDIEVSDHYGLRIDATATYSPSVYLNTAAPDMSGVSISSLKAKQSSITLSFNQGTGDAAIVKYNVKVLAEDGSTVTEDTVYSGYLDETLPDTLECGLTGLTAGTTYTAEITAVNIAGKESTPAKTTFKTADPVTPEAPESSADLFDLTYVDGEYKDASAAANDLLIKGKLGSSDSDDGAIAVFGGKGCIRTDSFEEYYDELSDGFTLEAYVKFSDLTGETCVIANMHAGGFSFDLEDNELSFLVYANGSYQGPSFKVSKNIWYHIVAVYNGTTAAIYSNGNLMDEVTIDGKISFATDAGARYLCIGGDSSADGKGEYYMSGELKIARVYSEPLTEANISYLNKAAKQ